MFQRLIRFHLNDEEPDALFDVDLVRLKFVYDNAVMEQADAHYLAALQRLIEKYKDHSMVAEAQFHKAKLFYKQGQAYKPSYLDEVIPPAEEAKWGFKKALELCQQTQKDYPDSRGAKLSTNLVNSITGSNLGLNMEQVNLPNQTLLSSIEYRNLDKVYFKVVKLSETQLYGHALQSPSE